MIIRRATIEDVPRIVDLIKKIHVKNLDSLEGGFLTAPDVTIGHYRQLVGQGKFCYVVDVGGMIAGLIMASPFGRDWKNNYDYYSNLFSGKDFIFIERVGILPEFRHQGLAKKLYERVFCDSKGKLFVACVSKNPRNAASEEFHIKMGFKKIGERQWDNGTQGFIYAREL